MRRKNRFKDIDNRKSQRIPVRPLIRIVCEGATEGYYFDAIRMELKASTITIDIKPAPWGCDPKSLLKFCKQEKGRDEYEKVFCVFDSDNRTYISNVIDAALKAKINVIFSNPCFEFWYILHFEYTTRSFSVDEAESELKNYLPWYKKEKKELKQVYSQIKSSQDKATSRAKKVIKYHEDLTPASIGNIIIDRPVTNAHELVDVLLSLRPR